MIVQVVKASIKPEQRARWLEIIRQNAAETRAQEGCESYQVAEDLEVPNSFVLVEHWKDLDAIHNHFRAHFAGLMTALGDVLSSPPEARFYEVASTMTLDEVLRGIRAT